MDGRAIGDAIIGGIIAVAIMAFGLGAIAVWRMKNERTDNRPVED